MDQESKGANISKVFHIDGMTCAGCENKIEHALKKVEGVQYVKVSFSNQTAEVNYLNNMVTEKQIINQIESKGYKVVTAKRYTKIEQGKAEDNNIMQFIGVIIVLIAIYIIIQNTIGFNFIPQISNNVGYGMLFVIGLLTSIHCVAMCGGINISQCSAYKKENNKSKYTPSILYNLGRVISYTIIGGIFGAFGSLISISLFVKSCITIFSGILMLIMGLNMLNIFPWLRKFNPRMPKFISNKINKENSNKGPLLVGLFNGLMPCGPLQAMQIYALGTGSFLAGSLSMLLFSLGTVPLMFGLGALSSILTSKFQKKMIKVSSALVIILGVVMISRGFSLSGVSLFPNNVQAAASNNTTSSNVAVIKDGVQYVTITLTNGNYYPIIVQKGIPVKWTIKAENGDVNGCNNTLLIPKYNVTKKLETGDNIIEFTPKDTGNVIYTCWMGMISSNIEVVDDLSKISQNDLNTADQNSSTVNSYDQTNTSTNTTTNTSNSNNISASNIAVIKDGVQTVSAKFTNGRYAPIIVQKGIPVKWTINADSSIVNSCSGSMLISDYNITKDLNVGDNIIEFTPKETGTVGYSCWMGMVSSSIKVVDDITKVTQSDLQELQKSIPASSTGGCCGVSY